MPVTIWSGDQVRVHFIGAGPGAADLITVRGRDLIAAAPVCLYAGALVPVELLDHCPLGARKVDTADLNLDEIITELVAAHAAGLDVARLHSGDPSVFSAMAEQMRRLDDVGIPYDVTPGVPAYAAAAATLRPGADRARGRPDGDPHPDRRPGHRDAAGRGSGAPWARAGATMVLHLAVAADRPRGRRARPHYGADCPVAVVACASRDDEVILRGTLADIADQVRAADIRRTAVIIVGKVLAATAFRDSHLYSAARTRP